MRVGSRWGTWCEVTESSFAQSVLLDAIWPQAQISYRDMLSKRYFALPQSTADAVCFRWRPGLDAAAFGHYVIPRKLEAPRSYVRTTQGHAAAPA